MELTKKDATGFFSAFYRGEHHIPDKLKEYGEGWSVDQFGDLSTHDFDALTRLVILAHQYAIRASIVPCGPKRITIVAHRRYHDREEYWAKHPTLDDLINHIKEIK